MKTFELINGWKAREMPDGQIEIINDDGNIVRSIKGCSLEAARDLFMLGWDVGHIETANNLRRK